MVKVKNISKLNIAIPNFPIFKAGEIREVSKEEARTLKKNPNIKSMAKPRVVIDKKEGINK